MLKIHLLALQIAFVISTLSGAPPSVPAAPVQRAQAFVDSIGVNTHLGYSDTPYGRFRKVARALERLGIHHIRDGIAPGEPELDARFRALAARGIKLDALVGDPDGETSLRQQLTVVERQIGPGVVESLEGPNEFDNAGVADWVGPLRSWVRRLWEEAKRRPSLRGLPIIGPSFVNPESRGELGNVSAWTSFGNMHPYPGGYPPDEAEHLDSELALAAINTPGERVQATETGYTTSVNATDNQPPVSERSAGIYMPRLLLENFRRGIARTYIYELLDEHPDPGLEEGEEGFGILRNNFRPKPAATAIRNLTSILADPGPARAPEQLEYTLTEVPAETRQVLLQKSDGSYFLALWNPVSVWDVETGTPWIPPAIEGTLHLAAAARRVSILQPNRSSEPIATVEGATEVRVPVGPRVTIVEVQP